MEIAKNFNSHFMINGRLACDNPAYQEKGVRSGSALVFADMGSLCACATDSMIMCAHNALKSVTSLFFMMITISISRLPHC